MRRLWKWIKRVFRKKPVSLPRVPQETEPDIILSGFVPSKYQEHYTKLWETMEIRDSKKSTISWYTKQAIKNRERYEKVADRARVPWKVIAVIHLLESSGDFKGVLHNGDEIIGTGLKTYRVPKGRGPFNTWEEAAMDALGIKKQPLVWAIADTLYYLELYNGLGYLRDPKKPNTPYLWSFSNHYIKGKYVSDGKYSSTAVSKQCGAAVILKELGYEQS
jgi:lysozyme family protein